jgi:hypothetical protein
MLSSGILHRVALERIDVSKESITSILGVTTIDEIGTVLVVTSNRHTLRVFHPDDGGTTVFRNVGSYKRHSV